MVLRQISSFCNIDFLKRGTICAVFVALTLAVCLLIQPSALAQQTSSTLTGTVFDASGAVVGDAMVTLKNEASGDLRSTSSNGDGYFTFAAVPSGTYSVSVTKDGFSTWEAKSVVLNSAEKRNLSGISLKPGARTETVVVEAAETQITPEDSGEKSTIINQKIMQNVAIIGQNAAEFVKIMPGMAFTGGVVNQSSYAASDERTGSGPVGSFSANGTRTAALDITSDGAHIIDPGCNCGQAMNTNADMTAELKVMTSNFGADESKGPVTISAIGKSGGNTFHGEAYVYARYYSLNANDPQNKNSSIARPETKYMYPGFQIGGPVILPHSDFNRNRDKMFFFFGTEYYKQDVDNGVYHAVVPTADMRNAIFTGLSSNPANGLGCGGLFNPITDSKTGLIKNYSQNNVNCYISSLNGYALNSIPGVMGGTATDAANSLFQSINLPTPGDTSTDCNKLPDGTGGGPCASRYYTNGVPKANSIDPNGLILMNRYPMPNQDPSKAGAGGFNYANGQTRYSNMLQFRGRVDYNITQSTKLYVSYNHQHDNALNSLDVLWGSGGNSWAAPTTPYPSPIKETTTSDVVTANLTKVFSPSLTNEVVFSYTYLNLPNSFSDRSKVERGSLGLNYNLLFSHPNQDNMIFPQMTGWGDGISNMLNTGFELNGSVYARKTLPSVADNLIKVWKTHTTKFGFYWERTWNEQPGNSSVNGSIAFANWGGGTTGNAYSDMLVGQTAQYSETNFDVVPAFRYITAEFYATDSWKISRRLTLDYGMRFSHLGPWSDTTGYGFAAWYPDLYSADKGGSVAIGANTATFPGIEWNKVNSSTALSGSGSRLFFYNPRVGFAWDLFGTGRTVLRGGYGMYRFHDEQNVQNGAYGIVRGSFASPTLNNPKLSELGPSLATINAPSGVTVLDPKDDFEPRTQSYSFTLAERLPWKSQLEVAYVGSKSDYLSNWNNNFDQINDLGIGAMFNANTCPDSSTPKNYNQPCGWQTGSYDSTAVVHARPLYSGACVAANNCLGTVKIIDHKMYSNYNSLQVTWNRQAGRLTFLTNYTFSKALGIRGEGGAASGDPTVLANNYGTLTNNRTHIFNVAYVYEFPKIANGNAFVKQVANGWQISGIGQYQTGADLQASVSSNFGYSAFIPAGTTFMGKTLANAVQASASNVLGTPDLTLMPALTCDPRSGLKANQYINGACFSGSVTPGQQGAYIFPALTGPGFFNTDLSIFKNFTFGKSESRKLQFRFSGYNFLNHPNRTFLNGDQNLNLSFNSSGALSNPNFGTATNTIGHRILQMMIKFSF